ncbi:MAG: squalene/phytoene synthase family protein [Magnetovibrio sp.]|nr:squalene/phytoene synthase family protein [Magnetovibrio sp.]
MPTLDPENYALARSDRARYLCALAAPRRKRDSVLTLLAFDQEIARIPKLVSEPSLGAIRLQWWLDALSVMAESSAPTHPILKALAPLGLDVDGLRRLVEARNFDLELAPVSMTCLQNYALATGGAFQALVLDLLGVVDPEVHQAARYIGAAATLANLMQGDTDIAPGVSASQLKDKAEEWLEKAQNFDLSPLHKKSAQPILLLAPLVKRRLTLGDGANETVAAVVRVWWGKATGRY